MFNPLSHSFMRCCAFVFAGLILLVASSWVGAAESLTGIHSSRVMSQSMPWIAQETGLFKKYDIDFRLQKLSEKGEHLFLQAA